MCASPFVTKQRPPIWKILDPPLNINFNYLELSFLFADYITDALTSLFFRKSVPSSPPIDENEVLVNDFVLVDANDNEIVETDETEDGVPSVKEKKKKRKVSFADAIGKELEQVKIFEEPEYILPIRPKEPEPELQDLELMDPLPAMESEIFNSRFEKNHLILEKLNLGTVNIAGRIRITSLPNGEQRRVAIRYTKDGWMSFTKQPARFFQAVKSAENSEKSRKGDKKNKSSDHVSHDLYCFEIAVDKHSPGVQFLITSCDARGKAEFEDNNDGNNYTVINPNYAAPPEDDEEAGWNLWVNDDNDWCNDYY